MRRQATVACGLCALSLVIAGCGSAQHSTPSSGTSVARAVSSARHSSIARIGASLDLGYDLKLVPRADGSLFAVSQHGLGQVNLFDIQAHAGSVTVTDHSAAIQPPWSTFEGSEVAEIAHTQSGRTHVLAALQNQVDGRLATITSTDDGHHWRLTTQAFTHCGEFQQRFGVVGKRLILFKTEACDTSVPAQAWQGTLNGGWHYGYQLPALEFAQVCSTGQQLVWVNDIYSNDKDHWQVSRSTDGVHWQTLALPKVMAVPPSPGAQVTPACDPSGFLVYSEKGALRWDAPRHRLVPVPLPPGGGGGYKTMRLSRGVIIAWNQHGVYYLRAGRREWTLLLRKQMGFDDVYDAAVSANGDIYVVALTKSYNDDHIYLWTTAAKPPVLPSDPRAAAQTLLSRLASARTDPRALAALLASVSPELIDTVAAGGWPNVPRGAVVGGCSKFGGAAGTPMLTCKIKGFAANLLLERSPNGTDWVGAGFAQATP